MSLSLSGQRYPQPALRDRFPTGKDIPSGFVQMLWPTLKCDRRPIAHGVCIELGHCRPHDSSCVDGSTERRLDLEIDHGSWQDAQRRIDKGSASREVDDHDLMAWPNTRANDIPRVARRADEASALDSRRPHSSFHLPVRGT